MATKKKSNPELIIRKDSQSSNEYDKTKVICQEPSIALILKEQTPNIAKLFKQKPNSTLQFLNAESKKYTINFNFKLDNDNDPKELFFSVISENIDNNPLFNSIIEYISENLNESFKSKNNNSETNFEINITNYFETEENYIIWSCIRWIKVKKNIENIFEIFRSIDIKIVIFNYKNVNELENTEYDKALELFSDNTDLYFDNL